VLEAEHRVAAPLIHNELPLAAGSAADGGVDIVTLCPREEVMSAKSLSVT
jgi:hypothetical protein